MAEPGDEIRPEDEEVGGGAVKSFLEHLEDLRWMLIKSGAATLCAMMLCLFSVPRLMHILQWPLDRSAHYHATLLPKDTNQVVIIQMGAARLPPLMLKTNHIGSLDLGTNHFVTLDLVPVEIQGQTLLAMRLAAADSKEPEGTGPGLLVMDVPSSFMVALHVAFFGGLIIASPFVIYYVGQFVMPALKIREKKYFLRAFIIGTILFLTGVCFAYFYILPPALKFAEQFSKVMGLNVPGWMVESYVSFVMKFMLGMGLGFELPVVLLALVKIGVLDYAKLSKMRRYMIIANLVLGALLTTPEVFTQIVMAIALQILFEASVWIAWYWERQEKKRAKQPPSPSS